MKKKKFVLPCNFDIEKFVGHFGDKISKDDLQALKDKRTLARQKARERYELIKITPELYELYKQQQKEYRKKSKLLHAKPRNLSEDLRTERQKLKDRERYKRLKRDLAWKIRRLEIARNYYRRHKEKLLDYKRNYRAQNLEKMRAYEKERFASLDKKSEQYEKIKAQKREWARRNREKLTAQQNEYKRKNKERWKETLKRYQQSPQGIENRKRYEKENREEINAKKRENRQKEQA